MLASLDEPRVHAGDHVVQFYERDEGLALAVSSFLGAGLVAGETALVVATPAHCDAIDAVLAAAGVDVSAARASGHYLTLDAQELLEAFVVDGVPDGERFRGSAGSLVAKLASSGRRLRIYGEMVAVLWDRGAVGGAIALEALWNELAAREEFTLYCAYPARAMSGRSDGQQAVCDHHSAVLADPAVQPVLSNVVSRRFEPTYFSAPVARRFVTGALELWGLRSLVDVTELVLAELVSNAIRHGARRFRVTLIRGDDGVRLEVSDPSVQLPTLRAEDPDNEMGGRGIRLVEALCRSWGVDLHDVPDGGKTIWADIGSLPA